jgi:pimeloyl-ACP methyl ester carboxylesterase
MSYVTGGQGDPVLLLHGLAAGSFIWRRALPTLARHYTVYAPDMLGCHLSDKPAIDYSVDAIAEYARQFMNVLGVQRTHLIAHSMGGPVALTLCHAEPWRVGRLVLVASGGLGRAVHWYLRLGSVPGAALLAAVLADARSPLCPLGRRLERHVMRRWHVADDDAAASLLVRLKDREQRRTCAMMVRALCDVRGQTVNLLPLLPKLVGISTLIVWGGRDPIIPLAHGRRAAQLMCGARLAVLPDCFHDPELEEPDQFNTLVLGFLAGAPAGRLGDWDTTL